MAQHNYEHLTMAQLSAYLDQELASGELALCSAHLATCPLCQAALADLRLTSSLLHGLPQAEVPRSFVLPINIAVLPETPVHAVQHARQSGRSQYIWKRSLRAVSTLAAIIGMVFILAGALTALPHGGVTMTTSAPSSGSQAQHAASSAATPAPSMGPYAKPPTRSTADQGTTTAGSNNTPTTIPQPVTPQPTARGNEFSATRQPEMPPAALDPGKPEGRLGIGSALFILGILGVLLTRRSRRDP